MTDTENRSRWPRLLKHPLQIVRWLLSWIGQHEPAVLLAMLLMILAAWAFVQLADEVTDGDTAHFDEWAVRALRHADNPSQPLGPRWLWEVGRDMTALGGMAVLTLITAAVAGFLWLKRLYGAMLLVLAATIGGTIASLLLKEFFERPRPELVPHLSQVYTSSFPSGHAMLSATVYLTLGTLLGQFVQGFHLKAYFLIVAAGLTMLVGLSRVYMGVHYPTDVLAGWAAGLTWALGCWLVARWLQNKGAVEPELDTGHVAKP